MLKFYAKIKPGSRQDKVCGWLGDIIKIEIKAQAVDGKANIALIKYLSDKTGIAKSLIRIKNGHTSRMKMLVINDDISIDELRRKLA